MTDLDKDDSSDFLITSLGMAAIALIAFLAVLFLLSFTETGRLNARELIKA